MADHVFTKCAWRLIPFIALLYLVNYIDRTNAGFAALTMNKAWVFRPGCLGWARASSSSAIHHSRCLPM